MSEGGGVTHNMGFFEGINVTVHHEMSRLSPNFDFDVWCFLTVFFMLFSKVKTVFEYVH